MQPCGDLLRGALGQPAGLDEVQTGAQALEERVGLLQLAVLEVLLQLGELLGELLQTVLGVLALGLGARDSRRSRRARKARSRRFGRSAARRGPAR
jgi:hypothetical protein